MGGGEQEEEGARRELQELKEEVKRKTEELNALKGLIQKKKAECHEVQRKKPGRGRSVCYCFLCVCVVCVVFMCCVCVVDAFCLNVFSLIPRREPEPKTSSSSPNQTLTIHRMKELVLSSFSTSNSYMTLPPSTLLPR